MEFRRSAGIRLPMFLSIASFCAVTLLAFFLYRSNHRVAYVRAAELVYGYNGMRDARSEFKANSDAWQANIDTLRMQYQRSVSEFQQNSSSLNEKEKSDKLALIRKLEENLTTYTKVIQQQSQEQEKQMTEAVVNQINSYVEEYARKKGYDFIIAGANGNLLYGNKAYDITDEVLQAINKEYKIMPSKTTDNNEVKK